MLRALALAVQRSSVSVVRPATAAACRFLHVRPSLVVPITRVYRVATFATVRETIEKNAVCPSHAFVRTQDLKPSKSTSGALVPVEEAQLPVSTVARDPYDGISQEPFPKEVAEALTAALTESDVEIKPDGQIYLPEIKYRRVLNRSFGPGGWALQPRGPTSMQDVRNGFFVFLGSFLLVFMCSHAGGSQNTISREYAMFCLGRFVSQARGEQQYFDSGALTYSTAAEAAKSNALVRCCKARGP
jgi:hypothetical protein